ncbi:MAG: undecaprenyl diphosphate synthase family protein, partial [Candidatus Nanopelagicales bacterium]
MGLSDLAYGVYERRLYAQLAEAAKCGRTPKHVGVILDGNRRWASAQGSASSVGHAAGAAKIVDFLGWCDDADVEVVTLWLLSTDNLARPQR